MWVRFLHAGPVYKGTGMISSSPKRGSFNLENYIKRCQDEGEEPDPLTMEIYRYRDSLDPAVDNSLNMEWDLRTTDWILTKVRASESYAQNLYAAMCNNDFQKNEVWPQLKNQTWSCSWRYAGGIVADMRQEGDYIDWYCSGIGGGVSDEEFLDMSKESQERYLYVKNNFVSESVVTDEIREDLFRLGWMVVDVGNE
jgi:hypothetical protein